MSKEATQQGEKKMDLSAAVNAALKFFRELYPSGSVLNVLLEEVEEREGNWLITLGFDTDRIVNEPMLAGLKVTTPLQRMLRVYKTFTVDAKSGKVRSMKMHPPLP